MISGSSAPCIQVGAPSSNASVRQSCERPSVVQTARPASPPGHHSLMVPLVAGWGGGAGGLRFAPANLQNRRLPALQTRPIGAAPLERDVAQPGSASHWGCGGRRFESSRPDQWSPPPRLSLPSPRRCIYNCPQAQRMYVLLLRPVSEAALQPEAMKRIKAEIPLRPARPMAKAPPCQNGAPL